MGPLLAFVSVSYQVISYLGLGGRKPRKRSIYGENVKTVEQQQQNPPKTLISIDLYLCICVYVWIWSNLEVKVPGTSLAFLLMLPLFILVLKVSLQSVYTSLCVCMEKVGSGAVVNPRGPCTPLHYRDFKLLALLLTFYVGSGDQTWVSMLARYLLWMETHSEHSMNTVRGLCVSWHGCQHGLRDSEWVNGKCCFCVRDVLLRNTFIIPA